MTDHIRRELTGSAIQTAMGWALSLILLLAAVPSFGQTDGRDQSPDRDRLVRELQEELSHERRQAEEWAARRNVSRRHVQADGRAIELVGFRNGEPIFLQTFNTTAAATTRTTALHPGGALGLNLTGQNMTIGIWDEGYVREDHVELNGRVDHRGSDADHSDHATHVGGTLAATGVDENARGMAYEARLHSYSWDEDATEMASAASSQGLLVSNHSYGQIAGWHHGNIDDDIGEAWYWFGDPRISEEEDYSFGRYSGTSQRWDRITADNFNYLPVVAAGNDRATSRPSLGNTFWSADRDLQIDEFEWREYSTITDFYPEEDGGAGGFRTINGAAAAKNVLTVGSVADRTGQQAIRSSFFSSYGPMDDGRIKPDIVANGETLYSLSADESDAYVTSSGTSMATPNAAGTLTLLQQHYNDVTGDFMRAATLKGLVIHTAEDAGPQGPDYAYGWGLLNAEEAANQISDVPGNRVSVVEAELPQGSSFTESVIVPEHGPFRVTISWTDPQGSPIEVTGPGALNDPTPALVNDLDLRVVSSDTDEVFFPWVLDPANPQQPAATGDNTVDPVEQIFIADAQPGEYTIQITHKGVLQRFDPQPFSLFVSGGFDRLRAVAVTNITSSATVDGVTLEWQTLFEREAGVLEIRRSRVLSVAGGQIERDVTEVVSEINLEGDEDSTTSYSFFDALVPAGRYIYEIVPHTPAMEPYIEASVTVDVPTPRHFTVLSNYPNPFGRHTTIRLDLPMDTSLQMDVINSLGRRVASLADQEMPAARHEFPIDASSWSNGVYFVRITTSEGTLVHKMVRID